MPFFQNKEMKAEKLKEKKEQEKLEEEKARAAAQSLRGQREPSFYSRSEYIYIVKLESEVPKSKVPKSRPIGLRLTQ